MTGQDAEPGLAPHLSRILEQDYPRSRPAPAGA